MSKHSFQLSSIACLEVLSWYIRMTGIFQLGAKWSASVVGISRTKKSLNKCHLFCSVGFSSEIATLETVSLALSVSYTRVLGALTVDD